MAGVGRTTLAMARAHDLPTWLAAVHPRHRVPHHAEIALAVIVSGLVALTGLRDAIGLSSFGVLLYYLVANLSALTQTAHHRRFPRWWHVLGALLCLVLVCTLPWRAVVTGLIVIAAGAVIRAALHRMPVRSARKSR
jgi:basic amino acid/polyamine antiporter, APA family